MIPHLFASRGHFHIAGIKITHCYGICWILVTLYFVSIKKTLRLILLTAVFIRNKEEKRRKDKEHQV